MIVKLKEVYILKPHTMNYGKLEIIFMKVDIFNTDKKYNIIYADPPWQYDSRMAEGRGAKRSSSQDYYDVMSVEEICSLPINGLAHEDCILFLWCTSPKMNIVFKVIESWGFSYKTFGFVWVKRNKVYNSARAILNGGLDDFMGQGRWTRGNAEYCLIATKGNPKRISSKVRQIIYRPIEQHSKKPDIVRDRIVELCGDVPRIELFARQSAQGWDCWGNQAPDDSGSNDVVITSKHNIVKPSLWE